MGAFSIAMVDHQTLFGMMLVSFVAMCGRPFFSDRELSRGCMKSQGHERPAWNGLNNYPLVN